MVLHYTSSFRIYIYFNINKDMALNDHNCVHVPLNPNLISSVCVVPWTRGVAVCPGTTPDPV